MQTKAFLEYLPSCMYRIFGRYGLSLLHQGATQLWTGSAQRDEAQVVGQTSIKGRNATAHNQECMSL